MLRRALFTEPYLALALLLVSIAQTPGWADPPAILSLPGDTDALRNRAPPDAGTLIEPDVAEAPPSPTSLPAGECEACPSNGAGDMPEPDSCFTTLKWLGLRHSSFSGRNAGMGIPLTGTSWLNRPYYFGGDIGTMWLTRPINSSLSTDTDTFGGVFAGCDWDYYWGSEFSISRATPEIINENVPHTQRGDRLMEETVSLMYYPWGDSLFRPYWRVGIGATSIDFPTDDGLRRDEMLWTFPIGIGVKYPFRRFLAARAEFTDQLALGNSGVATQHDLTLTFGLEWRFGVHPRSYWPWNPSRHIW